MATLGSRLRKAALEIRKERGFPEIDFTEDLWMCGSPNGRDSLLPSRVDIINMYERAGIDVPPDRILEPETLGQAIKMLSELSREKEAASCSSQ